MPFYVMASLDLNWLLGLLGLGENIKKTEANISDDNTKNWRQHFVLWLSIVIVGIWWWLLKLLEEDRESNPNGNEVDQEEEMDHPSDELNHFFEFHHEEQEHLGDELSYYFDDGRRNNGCTLCGNFSTTRCSRCKAARYCSMKCQIIHWRSGHKYECSEPENTDDEARPTRDDGISKLFEISEKESTPNGSDVDDGVNWSLESNVGVKEPSGSDDVNNFHGCEVCGSPSTTTCSRCKTVKYCSVRCLIKDWRWHKNRCIIRDVDSATVERTHRDVGLIENSYEEEENSQSSAPLALEFHPGFHTFLLFSSKLQFSLSFAYNLINCKCFSPYWLITLYVQFQPLISC
ncbi:hypothetical protein Fmac_020507 [Flemingia macrophylla]|uniref:MYND-type domain-containing protein n=1 Tax=Flemingia macrophylla TaxID=520843 RepID=A0ABD1LW07_9FABA